MSTGRMYFYIKQFTGGKMTYYHGFQQTQKSGLDKEMRLASDPEFTSFVRSKRKLLALKNFTVKEQWAIIPAEKKHISWKEKCRKQYQWEK